MLRVAQSVISAYESDRREPGLAMLTKLVEAAGHELVIDVRPSPTLRLGIAGLETRTAAPAASAIRDRRRLSPRHEQRAGVRERGTR